MNTGKHNVRRTISLILFIGPEYVRVRMTTAVVIKNRQQNPRNDEEHFSECIVMFTLSEQHAMVGAALVSQQLSTTNVQTNTESVQCLLTNTEHYM